MHNLLSTERPGPDAAGHHRAETSGYGRVAEPHQAASKGNLPSASPRITGRLGHCAEPASRSRHGRLPFPGAGTAASFPRRATQRLIRAGDYGLKLLLLGLIRFYQICLSPIAPSSCRFYPSCSAYAFDAVARWGAWEGTRLAVHRLLRCRPWGGRGYDPVP